MWLDLLDVGIDIGLVGVVLQVTVSVRLTDLECISLCFGFGAVGGALECESGFGKVSGDLGVHIPFRFAGPAGPELKLGVDLLLFALIDLGGLGVILVSKLPPELEEEPRAPLIPSTHSAG